MKYRRGRNGKSNRILSLILGSGGQIKRKQLTKKYQVCFINSTEKIWSLYISRFQSFWEHGTKHLLKPRFWLKTALALIQRVGNAVPLLCQARPKTRVRILHFWTWNQAAVAGVKSASRLLSAPITLWLRQTRRFPKIEIRYSWSLQNKKDEIDYFTILHKKISNFEQDLLKLRFFFLSTSA